MMEWKPLEERQIWDAEGIPILEVSVNLLQPAPETGRVPRRLRAYYRQQSRSYLQYCRRWLLPQARAEYRAALAVSAPLPCFRAELTAQVTLARHRLVSLCTQSREQTSQRLLTRRGDTWDLTTGYPLPLSAFFPPRTPWKQLLLSQARSEIQRREARGEARFLPGWPRLLRRRFNALNFFLTEEGLVFFFPMYALAPAAEGIPSFLLPWGSGGLRIPETLDDPAI